MLRPPHGKNRRLKNLTLEYNRKKRKIKQRLKEFRQLGKGKDEDIFAELCFCILTPQSKAIYCDKTVQQLKKSRLLFNGNKRSIRCQLKKVRFPNNKAGYLVAAMKLFKNAKSLDVKSKLNAEDSFEMRNWLVKNVKGIGYKEASHFLRNIGLGKNLAILDTHILRNLKKFTF